MINITNTQEIWKPIPGYNNWYMVSNQGRVLSKDKVFIDKNGIQKKYKGKVLKPRKQNSGYYVVDLYIGPGAKRTITVHKLVGTLFVKNPNPKKYNQLDHIDQNKEHNTSDNLRWVDNSMNSMNKHDRSLAHGKVPVLLKDINTNEILYKFNSIKDASKFINRDCKIIRNLLKSNNNIKYGYKWEKSSTTIENEIDNYYTIFINV